ncbi:spore coat protein [Paenibacillus terreus]|uniref:Spore coat protein n=1 Tax=Paenibacillus terreus TaxID=1387834 RepID=A0ABV5B374_9BACL
MIKIKAEHKSDKNTLTDQMIAAELLASVKSGIMNCAMALTQAATSETRSMLCDQLSKAVTLHEQIFDYMHKKGWYEVHDIDKQLQADLRAADTALNLQNDDQSKQ